MDVQTFDEMYGDIKELRKELEQVTAERDYYKSQYEQLKAECYRLENRYHALQDDVQLIEMRMFAR